jgi:hypothetical protein
VAEISARGYNLPMQSKATTVPAYLRSLPPDRRVAISAVRDVILKNLDSSYEEGMQYGMIGYYVPHSLYPKGYHVNPKQPLTFAALGSQKNYMSLYLMCVYAGSGGDGAAGKHADWFRAEWAKTGTKLDMGKSCIRFKKADDLPLDLIGKAVKRMPASSYIQACEAALAGTKAAEKRKRQSA